MVRDGVWTFYESLAGSDRSRLTPLEQVIAAICDWRQEVNSSGFDSYFRYWGGDTAPTALSSLAALLGPEWAQLLDEAIALLGASYPREQDRRAELLDSLDLGEELEALDRRFYELEISSEADRMLDAALFH